MQKCCIVLHYTALCCTMQPCAVKKCIALHCKVCVKMWPLRTATTETAKTVVACTHSIQLFFTAATIFSTVLYTDTNFVVVCKGLFSHQPQAATAKSCCPFNIELLQKVVAQMKSSCSLYSRSLPILRLQLCCLRPIMQ